MEKRTNEQKKRESTLMLATGIGGLLFGIALASAYFTYKIRTKSDIGWN